MSEPVEVRVARVEEQLKWLIEDAREAKTARKAQYETSEVLSKSLLALASDMTEVKGKLAGQAPTIEEFITIKHRVVGAGKLGKYAWIVMGAVITFVWSSREAIINFLTGVK